MESTCRSGCCQKTALLPITFCRRMTMGQRWSTQGQRRQRPDPGGSPSPARIPESGRVHLPSHRECGGFQPDRCGFERLPLPHRGLDSSPRRSLDVGPAISTPLPQSCELPDSAVQPQNAPDLGNGLRVSVGRMAGWHDQFRSRPRLVRTPVFNSAIGALRRVSLALISYD